MYAVIKTGGKQYKVAAGEKIKSEQSGTLAKRSRSTRCWPWYRCRFEGRAPLVAGASVATVVAQGRHDKVRIFKMRRRKHYQKRQGHRQNFTEIANRRGERLQEGVRTMAQKKGGGSTRNGRDSQPKMLGVKAFGGQRDPGWFDHRAPARHQVPPRHQRRHRQGPHPVRPGGRRGTSRSRARNERHTVSVTRELSGSLATAAEAPASPGLFFLRRRPRLP